jgi:hypothetical protein
MRHGDLRLWPSRVEPRRLSRFSSSETRRWNRLGGWATPLRGERWVRYQHGAQDRDQGIVMGRIVGACAYGEGRLHRRRRWEDGRDGQARRQQGRKAAKARAGEAAPSSERRPRTRSGGVWHQDAATGRTWWSRSTA